jgi:hypothetical protein
VSDIHRSISLDSRSSARNNVAPQKKKKKTMLGLSAARNLIDIHEQLEAPHITAATY